MKQIIYILILILFLIGCADVIKTYEVKKVGMWNNTLWGKCVTRDNTTMRCSDCLTDAYVVCEYQRVFASAKKVCFC